MGFVPPWAFLTVARAGTVGHIGIPGPWPFIATGLFFAGVGAAFGAYWLFRHRTGGVWRAMGVAAGILAFGCLVLATAMPLIIHASPLFTRPSTSATLEILSPRPGEVLRGDPAPVPVEMRVEGGKVVARTSLHLIPNEGHIHLYLDGSLVSMTGLEAVVAAEPGRHTLRAEFVAVDHGPFRPRVVATVTFRVRPGRT
jgi:hypothetical protein